MVCCQEEQLVEAKGAELGSCDVEFTQEHGYDRSEPSCRHPAEPNTIVDAMPCIPARECQAEHPWGCCKPGEEPGSLPVQPMETLSYTPTRFDESATFDVERSHARYSKIIQHSTPARTGKRSKAWEAWLRATSVGRSVTLLRGGPEGADGQARVLHKIPALFHIDRGLTRLSILPTKGVKMSTITILVDNIQVICPATDFMLFFDQVETQLAESERDCAVLIQYVTDDTERKRVCFLEESEPAKERFVQALTSLWLEKRNDHSMWF